MLTCNLIQFIFHLIIVFQDLLNGILKEIFFKLCLLVSEKNM